MAILSPNPTSLNFGEVAAGSSATLTITLNNTTSTIGIIEITAATFDNPAFSLNPSVTFPIDLVFAGSSATWAITYTASPFSSPGPVTANLRLTGTATNNPVVVPLTVNIVDTLTPALSINPVAYTFPPTKDGQQSPPQTFTLTNTGQVALTINAIIIDTIAGFQGSNLPTLPVTLQAGDTLTFGVAFAPSGNGFFTDTQAVEIDSTAASSPNFLSLSGTAIAVTPAYNVIGGQDGSYAAFGNVLLQFDPANLYPEELTYGERVWSMSPGAENQVLQIELQYEDFGECGIRIDVTNEKGDVQNRTTLIGGIKPSYRVLNQLIDIGEITGELLTIRITPDGPFSMVAYMPRYVQQGEVTTHK